VLGVGVGHTGLYVDNGGEDGPIIYDPSGSYRSRTRPRNGIFEGDEVDWNDYTDYQKSTGEDVEIFTFPTTPDEEKQIADRARQQGDPRGFLCTTMVSGAIAGTGPFQCVKLTRWPRDLKKQLDKKCNK
jgi:hypothetical protein